MKSSMLFNLVFGKSTIVSSFFFFFLIIDFFISAVTVQICNPTTELVIPMGVPSKEAKAEFQTHPVTKMS